MVEIGGRPLRVGQRIPVNSEMQIKTLMFQSLPSVLRAEIERMPAVKNSIRHGSCVTWMKSASRSNGPNFPKII
jgi:hypothetical protein